MKIPEKWNLTLKGYKNNTRWKPTNRNRNMAPAPAPAPAPPSNDSLDNNDDDFLGVTMPTLAAPSPMDDKNKPVEWMFAFKFNAATFPSDITSLPLNGIFGGKRKDYKGSLDYVFATSASPTLTKGAGLLGTTTNDPLGATFGQIYNNNYFYVVWNDQFYNNPIPIHAAPWGHSKGILSWNANGNGMVLQVSTPSFPGSGSSAHPRENDGNTLGYIEDNNINVSQHFFALKLTKDDVIDVLNALIHASVVTDLSKPSIVKNGGPQDIQALVNMLGTKSNSTTILEPPLKLPTNRSGVRIISKPSNMHVPSWQMVSAHLNQLNLRVASWWETPAINSTKGGKKPGCWAEGLGVPGAVVIARSGIWNGTSFSLEGGVSSNHNHAKIGISTDVTRPLCIFGDLNQQGALEGQCSSSQNGRGGIFYVLENRELFISLTSLLNGTGDEAPTDSSGL